MKRVLLWSLLGLVVLVASLVSIVSVQVADVEPLPAPDPELPIVLGDGSTLPLAEVVDRAERGLPLPIRKQSEAALFIDGKLPRRIGPSAPPLEANLAAPLLGADIDTDPLFDLAEQHRAHGELEQALALYLSVPPDSEHYPKARRRAARNILARDMDKPEQAVRYANQALHADPLDGNAWQDWARVYGRTLGLPVD